MDNAPELTEELDELDELELLRLELEELELRLDELDELLLLRLELEELDTLLIELDNAELEANEELLEFACEELDAVLECDDAELDENWAGALDTLELLELESPCAPEQAAKTAVIVSMDIVFSWIFMT